MEHFNFSPKLWDFPRFLLAHRNCTTGFWQALTVLLLLLFYMHPFGTSPSEQSRGRGFWCWSLISEDQGKLSLMGFHKSFCVAAKHRNKPPASFQPQMAANLWFNSSESSACLPLTLCSLQQRLPVCVRLFKTVQVLVLKQVYWWSWIGGGRTNTFCCSSGAEGCSLAALEHSNQQSQIQMKKDYHRQSRSSCTHHVWRWKGGHWQSWFLWVSCHCTQVKPQEISWAKCGQKSHFAAFMVKFTLKL